MSYNLHITSVAQRDISQAADYIEFTRSQEGQQILENHGFTSVHSARGLDLIERFGVKDV